MDVYQPARSGTPDFLSRPKPPPARTPEQEAVVRRSNRRTEYLSRHPEYFQSDEHEFADPLLYDAYIRRFQSAAEREAEGKRKGYSRTLEASLLRGEEKLGRLRNGEVTGRVGEADDAAGQLRHRAEAEGDLGKPKTAEEGGEMWREFLTRRFLDGLDDGGFDYDAVDGNEELDVLARRDAEEEWFDDEPPEWAHVEGDVEGTGDEAGKDDTSGRRAEGETGIQDF